MSFITFFVCIIKSHVIYKQLGFKIFLLKLQRLSLDTSHLKCEAITEENYFFYKYRSAICFNGFIMSHFTMSLCCH